MDLMSQYIFAKALGLFATYAVQVDTPVLAAQPAQVAPAQSPQNVASRTI
jgi:hypothetical protein